MNKLSLTHASRRFLVAAFLLAVFSLAFRSTADAQAFRIYNNTSCTYNYTTTWGNSFCGLIAPIVSVCYTVPAHGSAFVAVPQGSPTLQQIQIRSGACQSISNCTAMWTCDEGGVVTLPSQCNCHGRTAIFQRVQGRREFNTSY